MNVKIEEAIEKVLREFREQQKRTPQPVAKIKIKEDIYDDLVSDDEAT